MRLVCVLCAVHPPGPGPTLCLIKHLCLFVAHRDVKRALLDADVNLKVTNALIEAVKEKALGTCVAL